MMTFSLGFWGNYHIHKQMLLYLDTMLYRRLQRYDSLTVWVALMSDCNLFIANRIIALRRIYPALKLCVVITDKQHGIYISRRELSVYDKQRNKAITASVSSAIIPDNAVYVRTVYSKQPNIPASMQRNNMLRYEDRTESETRFGQSIQIACGTETDNYRYDVGISDCGASRFFGSVGFLESGRTDVQIRFRYRHIGIASEVSG